MADLPAEPPQEVHQQEVHRVAYSENYAGPLPPPDLLNQFDTDTRAAIVNDFVAHSQHRRDMEQQALALSVELVRRGQDRATVIAIGGLVVAAIVAVAGQPLWGVVLALVDIGGGIAVSLLLRTRSRTRGRGQQRTVVEDR